MIETWDDDIGDREEVLARHNLSDRDVLSDTLLVIPQNAPDDPLFVLEERAIYRCPACRDSLETLAYAGLTAALGAVNRALVEHHHRYRSGQATKPDTIEVKMDVACSCTTHTMSFYRGFSEAEPVVDAALDFDLAGPEDPAMLSDIDGVYTRNDCVEIFKKLLLRWRARNRVVLLVVPFIGLDFAGREENRMELWNLIVGYTDPARTLMVTRRATFTGFLKAAEKTGLGIETLKKFGILAPMLDHLGSKQAVFKQESHAKFYASVGPDTTEVLSGSFNIHTGEYVENLLFKSYDTSEFLKRYLLPLGILFNLNERLAEREVLSLNFSGGLVKSTSSRKMA